MDFFKVVTLSDAQKIVLDNFDINSVKGVVVPLENAVGYRVSQDIISNENIPEYNRSTVDGYAVKAMNTYGATDSVPTMLRVLGRVEMGVVGGFTVHSGEAVYVPTGGAIPDGADAMVMVEHTEVFSENVAIYRPSAKGENIIHTGDDVRIGDVILHKGDKVTPQNAGVIASIGVSKIDVFEKIKVGIISTGDEIVGIDEKTQIGEIRDTNTTINATLCKENGFDVVFEKRIKDGFDLLDNVLLEGIDKCDIMLISGGSSIGSRDFTERVLEKNGEILVHGIALKPGKPTLIANVKNKLVFGLPGHPMACLLTLKLLVINTILSKFSKDAEKYIFATTSINFPSAPGRLTVQPVSLEIKDGGIFATPIFYKSGLVSVLSKADGFILIPENQEGIYKGQNVKVYLM